MKLSKKVAATAAAGAIAVAGAGAAFAYWTSTGSGTSTNSTSDGDGGTAEFLSVAQNESLANFYPGDNPQSFSAKVTNNSTDGSNVYVSSVKAYLSVDEGHPDCSAADYLLNGVAGIDSVAGAAVLHWTAQDLANGASDDTDGTDTIGFNNTNADQNGCKGAVVTIHYLAS